MKQQEILKLKQKIEKRKENIRYFKAKTNDLENKSSRKKIRESWKS